MGVTRGQNLDDLGHGQVPVASMSELEDALHDVRQQWLDVDVASLLIDTIRRERRRPTRQEQRVIHRAYEALAQGIGGAQILRYMDSDTGFHGPFQPENIPAILATRDEAASSPLGRAAALLARLDWLSSQGKLTDAQEQQREELFQALCRKEVEGLLEAEPLRSAA